MYKINNTVNQIKIKYKSTIKAVYSISTGGKNLVNS